MTAPAKGYTITAAGERERRYDELGPAVSLALTFGCRAAAGSSVYVRDAAGDVVARVDRDELGGITVTTTKREG